MIKSATAKNKAEAKRPNEDDADIMEEEPKDNPAEDQEEENPKEDHEAGITSEISLQFVNIISCACAGQLVLCELSILTRPTAPRASKSSNESPGQPSERS